MTAVTDPGSDDEPSVTERAHGHYFSAEPNAGSRPSEVRLALPDLTLDLRTDRGVFSPARVDPGTKLLLMELPPRLAPPVLDLGCGYGPLACTVALRQPEDEVWAVDVNGRARELCTANAQRAGAVLRVAPPEDVPADVRFGAIVSNPPIRIGKTALHDLLSRWLDRLAGDGEAWLVVNKHLGADSLAAWLADHGFDVRRARSRQGYRVLHLTRSVGQE